VRAEIVGSGPRVVLVHGSVSGPGAWRGQRELAGRFRLELLTRPGSPPAPPVESVDFEEHAVLLREHLAGEPAHLVGHSYGGVVCLLASVGLPLRSLTVIEPPCFGVAEGEPEVDEFVASMERHWSQGPRDPRAFLDVFLKGVGSEFPLPDPLPPELEQIARTLMVERLPSEAEIPLAELRAAPFPKLVVSGAHHPAFDAVCDVVERELPAERAVIPGGGGHAVQRVGEPFNDRLADFLARAERRAAA
jgi:pimeloyl-ACP methyl ester carboxylesterase